MLTGFQANPFPLPWHPFTLAALLSTERLPKQTKQLSDDFRQNIRRYNSALGFASFSDTHGSANKASGSHSFSTGPNVYVLHGRAYHVMGTLYPCADRQPTYCQLYVLDPADACEARSTSFDGLKSTLLLDFHSFLTEPILQKDRWTGVVKFESGASLNGFVLPRNPYPSHFLRMHELVQASLRDSVGDALASGTQHVLRFSGGTEKDPRRYNAPSAAEVSCGIVGDGPLPPHFISVYERADDGAGSTHELSYLSEHVDPLTYPIIHFEGDLGYSHALHARGIAPVDSTDPSSTSKTAHISMREFYAHRIMQRYTHESGIVEMPHAAGRLFQQYLVCNSPFAMNVRDKISLVHQYVGILDC